MPGMGLVQQVSQRQMRRQRQRQRIVHRAAWSTYVPRAGLGLDAPQTRIAALRSLLDRMSEMVNEGDRSELMLAGTALWNLLDVYKNGRPPVAFCELLSGVLQLDVQRARELHAQPAHWVFPPFPGDPKLDPESDAEWGATALVSDSSFAVQRNKRIDSIGDLEQKTKRFRTHASLQLVVRRDFDSLNALAYPPAWPELCPVFWRKMKRMAGGWKGQLFLPGVSETEPIKVTFTEVKKTESNAAKAEAEFEIKAPLIEGYLKFRMEPERSRPGWTRIIHERDVTFFSELYPYEVPTLAYWTKSEIACLALR